MKKILICLAVAGTCLGGTPAMATYLAAFDYSATDNGGGNYTFDFDVKNNSTGSDTGALDFFEITFDADTDASLYSNISWVSDNGWFSDAFQYDASFGGTPGGVNADDSLFGSGGGGIAKGTSQGGFRVSFDYAGSLGVDEQLFSFLADFGTSDTDNGGTDLGGYWVLAEVEGTASYQAPPSGGVPLPGTLLLLGGGLLGLLGARRRGLSKI